MFFEPSFPLFFLFLPFLFNTRVTLHINCKCTFSMKSNIPTHAIRVKYSQIVLVTSVRCSLTIFRANRFCCLNSHARLQLYENISQRTLKVSLSPGPTINLHLLSTILVLLYNKTDIVTIFTTLQFADLPITIYVEFNQNKFFS